MEIFTVFLIVLFATTSLFFKAKKTFKNGDYSCSQSCAGCSSCTSSGKQAIDLNKSYTKGVDDHA